MEIHSLSATALIYIQKVEKSGIIWLKNKGEMSTWIKRRIMSFL